MSKPRPAIDHARIIHILRNRAGVLNLIGRNDESSADLHRGLMMAQRHRDTKAQADCHLQLSDIYASTSNFKAMRDSATEALRLYREANDKKGEASSLSNLGLLHNSLGDYPMALDQLNKSLAIQREIGDRNGEAVSLSNIGLVHGASGDYQQALAYPARSLKIREETGDRQGQAATLNNIGLTHSYLGEYPRALEYHSRSLKIKREIGNRQGQAVSLTNIGMVLHHLGDYPGALECFKKSLTIGEQIGNRKGQADSLNSIGTVHECLGDLQTALAHYSKSLAIRAEIGDRNGRAISLNNIARVEMEQNHHDLAAELLADAEKLAREINAKEILRRIAVTGGELQLKLWERTPARNRSGLDRISREQAETAYRLGEELRSNGGKAQAALLRARIETASGNWHQADREFQKAIAWFEELKQPYETGKAYCYYGEMLLSRIEITEDGILKSEESTREPGDRRREMVRQSEEYLQQAREIFERIGARGWLEKITERP